MSEATGSVVNSYIRQSADTTELRAAVVKAQGKFRGLVKDRNVTVKTQGGGSYGFGYATLDAALDMTRTILAEEGLSCIQPITMLETGGMGLVTVVSHTSGQWMESVMPLPAFGADPQKFGSVVTYARRYAFTAFWNLAAEEDDDGNKAMGNTITRRENPAPQRTPPPRSDEETFLYTRPNGRNDIMRAEGGVSAAKRFVAAAMEDIEGAEPEEADILRSWWVEKQEPNLKALGAKNPDAEKFIRDYYKKHYEKLLAAVPPLETAS
jgi:hypothetical protein